MKVLADTRRISVQNKFLQRWIPKLLSAVEMKRRVECARSFLEMCGDSPDCIFGGIVTGVETKQWSFILIPYAKGNLLSGGASQ